MRHYPPPLLRLSAGAGGPLEPIGDDYEKILSATQYTTPSARPSSLSAVKPFPPYSNNTFPTAPHSPAAPVTFPSNNILHSRSSSLGTPHFPTALNNMFRIGSSRLKSPRRATSTYVSSSHDSSGQASTNPSSPTFMAIPDPLQRPFSPWDSSHSTDSQVSTSPRNSVRMQKGFYNKRSLSPTTSVSTSTTGASVMTRSTRSFLSRPRKHSHEVDSEFDPTTLRKNRSRPRKKGTNGQDALYHEYDDLFDDDLEDLGEELGEDGDMSHPSDVDEGDNDFFLLQMEERQQSHRGMRRSKKPQLSLQRSPEISPRTRRTSDPPRSVPASYGNGVHSNSLSPPPPTPPPKTWNRSITTTPPRTAPPSLDEPITPPNPRLVSAPPTPPPKIIPRISGETYSTNFAEDPNEGKQREPIPSPGPPPHRPPPPAPAGLKKSHSKRLSRGGRPLSIPDGLGIIKIPSPTLSATLFQSDDDGASNPTWTGQASHATMSSALTDRSYTPRQEHPPELAYESGEDEMNTKEMSGLFDEAEGGGVAPLFYRRESMATALGGSEAGTIKAGTFRLSTGTNPEPENPGDVSVVSEKTVVNLLTSMLEPTDEQESTDDEDDIVGFYEEKEVVVEDKKIPVVTEGKDEESKVPEDKEAATEEPKDESDLRGDPTFLQAFRTFVKQSGDLDPFIQRMPRYDALQAQRICGNMKVVNTKKKAPPPKPKSRIIKQREAEDKIATSLWALMAVKWMNFGKTLSSPAHEILLAASAKRLTRRATIKQNSRATHTLGASTPKVETPDGERRRVLDLSGLPVADWGWLCAYDYPKAKVYTVTVREQKRQKAAETPEGETPKTEKTEQKHLGPKNHRHLTVANLWKLPFPENHFDVVSARTLYTALKSSALSKSPNRMLDEYDRCLEECLRVLKPGGYLEFTLLDNDIINAGPLGTELSERFAAELHAAGYDPSPTKRWVSRLNKAGFGEIKRSWLFIPMAPPAPKPKVPSKNDFLATTHESQDLDMVKEEVRRKMEAWEDLGVQKGSLENVAPITGFFGSWIWEKWMLKIKEGKNFNYAEGVVDAIGSVLDEGRENNSGWRCLVGWARKPVEGEH
ncbi:hypothetical protein RUND412_002806 [Rhizina undulata]